MKLVNLKERPLPELEPFISDFLSDRFADYREIIQALNDNEFEKVGAIVHQWKGFCDPYGFPFLALIARDYERVIKEGETIDKEEFFRKIENYLNLKKRQLNDG